MGTLKQRLMLATLLVERGRMLSRAELIDELWGENPPATAVNALQVYAARLRRVLGPRLETKPGGYRLRAEQNEVDAWRFEEMARVGSAKAREDPLAGSAALAEALSLWRGPALSGIPPSPRTRAVALRLEETRLQAIESRVEAELALGHHRELVAEINGLVAANPTRERLTGLLMLALHRSGRSAEALSAYSRLADALDSDLGVDPSDELVALEHAIRRQDPTLEAPDAAHLPIAAGRFIGRRAELANVADLLHRTRLLTLVGPGGCGKTRLALELARASVATHPDGARFVSLVGLARDAAVATEVARALRLREPAGETPEEAVIAWLRHRRMILVLDNCEHVVEAVAALCGRLLESSTGLRILATSREPLMLAGETVWVVPGLSLPPPGGTVQEILDCDAVRLLADRAAQTRPSGLGGNLRAGVFGEAGAPIAAAICERLDGLPLAIELVAARMRSISLRDIHVRLDRALDLLGGASRTDDRRHQTMRAAIEWSHDLLDGEDRALFRRLSVFAGGFDIGAVEGTFGDAFAPAAPRPRSLLDGLLRLVDRSVVVAQGARNDTTRYRLLETIREFAWERLVAAGEEHEARSRHAAWYRKAVRHAVAGGLDQEAFVAWAADERENLGAALDWFMRQGGDPQSALELAAPLWVYWYQSGRAVEGLAWLRRALDATATLPTPDRALALRGAASLARSLGDLSLARRFGEESLAAYRAVRDDTGVASALNGLGATTQAQGDLEAAVRYGRESVEVGARTPNRFGLAAAQCNLGIALRCAGRPDEADAIFATSLEGFRDLGHRRGVAAVLNNQAITARQRGDVEGSRALALDAMRIYRDLDFAEGMADALEAIAALEVAGGRAAEGLRLYYVAAAERSLIGSALITPDERADHDAAVEAAIASVGAAAAAQLRTTAPALRFLRVVDELLPGASPSGGESPPSPSAAPRR